MNQMMIILILVPNTLKKSNILYKKYTTLYSANKVCKISIDKTNTIIKSGYSVLMLKLYIHLKILRVLMLLLKFKSL
jgi:hypothetical protein